MFTLKDLVSVIGAQEIDRSAKQATAGKQPVDCATNNVDTLVLALPIRNLAL